MRRKSKALIALPISLAVLFLSNGLASNAIYHNIEYSMLNSAERTAHTDRQLLRFTSGELAGYAIGPDYSSPHRTIIYFCGAGENAYNSVLKYRHLFPDFIFVCIDYPGTQDSGGKLSLRQLQKGALAVYDYAVKFPFVDRSHIYTLGYSYGTGMATYLASERDCAGLILVAPYRDTSDILRSKINIPTPLFKWALTGSIKTMDYAKSVRENTLLITSDNDEVFGSGIVRSLAGSFRHAKVSEFSGVSHSEYFSNSRVVKSIRDFCSE